MRFRFELNGEAYSRNKEAFKRVLAKYGLRWKGTLERPLWQSGGERVTAIFDRDADKDLLRHATLLWEGRTKSKLLEDLKEWTWEVGGKAEEERGPAVQEVSDEVEKALHFWDLVYEPNVDWLKAQGRPEAWIEEDLRRWKRQRQARQRELVGRAID